MFSITFNHKNRSFEEPVECIEAMISFGESLSKDLLAVYVNDQLCDLSVKVNTDAVLEPVFSTDPEGLEIIRHSCAHLFGHALKQFWPQIKMAIGPVIEYGFYYDVFVEDIALSDKDLLKIQKRMQKLASQHYEVKRIETPVQKAIEIFKDRDETYKLYLIEDILKQAPDTQSIGLYYHQEYIDMCRGPHVPNTRFLKHFKLQKISGAYWRGNSKNEMLQRIYGVAFLSQKDLDAHLSFLEEAEKRDHRKIAKQMDLFHIQEEAPGSIFWHPNGLLIYRKIQDHIRQMLKKSGYQEIQTPLVMDRVLWEKSGHWEKFSEMIFSVHSDHREYAIKPMNCPGHVQIFNQKLHSYRDLPIRLAEFGIVHRYEHSGTLHGLMRVRSFTQDDAHIFCTTDQLKSEIDQIIDQIFEIYQRFGFSDVAVKLSTRPEKRVGDDQVWEMSEKILESVLNDRSINWELQAGEGAFYGPKIEFVLKDCLGRLWQCGTIQLDFSMPERLGAQYVDQNSAKQVPVMIHRAILGSLERFIGILIEHYAGDLPLWMMPNQVAVLNVTDHQLDYVSDLAENICASDIRVFKDFRNEKIGYKIREAILQKIPYLLVVGNKEKENKTVSLRTKSDKTLQEFDIVQLIAFLKQKIKQSYLK